jgi:hypothetical protein
MEPGCSCVGDLSPSSPSLQESVLVRCCAVLCWLTRLVADLVELSRVRAVANMVVAQRCVDQADHPHTQQVLVVRQEVLDSTSSQTRHAPAPAPASLVPTAPNQPHAEEPLFYFSMRPPLLILSSRQQHHQDLLLPSTAGWQLVAAGCTKAGVA